LDRRAEREFLHGPQEEGRCCAPAAMREEESDEIRVASAQEEEGSASLTSRFSRLPSAFPAQGGRQETRQTTRQQEQSQTTSSTKGMTTPC